MVINKNLSIAVTDVRDRFGGSGIESVNGTLKNNRGDEWPG